MNLYKLVHFVTGNFYKLSFGVTVKGKENIPKEGGVILCSNHSSNFDPIALAILTTKRHVHFMAKKELFENKLLKKLMDNVGTFPIDREGNDLKAIKTALRILKNDGVVGIFPEGTRTKDMDLTKAKGGVTMIAIKAQVPIVPVHIKSNYKFLEPLQISIKEPIYYNEFYGKKLNKDDYNELSEELLKTIYGK
ncbi:MAG: lysophospholipid acyltransferase family protein [Andreesenia angusta]|nr:lysophospholipid acyltransferase family protein [Andreesenia angusta]